MKLMLIYINAIRTCEISTFQTAFCPRQVSLLPRVLISPSDLAQLSSLGCLWLFPEVQPLCRAPQSLGPQQSGLEVFQSRAELGDLQYSLFPTELARDKIAFFTLFHSPSGAGCTPKGREAVKGIGGGNQPGLFALEGRTCGPRVWTWYGEHVGDVCPPCSRVVSKRHFI